VSNGVNTVMVPDVLNQESRKAETTLLALGLQVEIIEEYNDDIEEDLIIKTEPGSWS
jgi:beta-lactam-binding protein with PASTA domain